MSRSAPLVEIWRGEFLESRHSGHLVVFHADQGVLLEWGESGHVNLPRSSAKMIQALPLLESGAWAAAGLGTEHLALACASHQAATIHTKLVATWLEGIGLGDDALRCGGWPPGDPDAAKNLTCSDTAPCQWHNECSGKHAGFLTVSQHLGAGPEYLEIDHPVQIAVREAFEDVTGAPSPGWVIDGCSAPNFACSMTGMAKAMARFASASANNARGSAMVQLRDAMMKHPDLVAGETRCCTDLMRAMDGRAAIKTGAEGYFVAIVPGRQIGVALKVDDGAKRASECAMAATLVALGVLERAHPATRKWLDPEIRSKREIPAGRIQPSTDLVAALSAL